MEYFCSLSFVWRECFWLVFLIIIKPAQVISQKQSSQTFPAVFIFGDSLVDVGNNNYIISLAKANSPPYGIDFPAGATGRFCNGKTVLDVVCDLIGVPLVPPFLDPRTTGTNILQGVNYASGAGGILDESGANYISRISMSQQIRNFNSTLGSLYQSLGATAASSLLSQSLFAVVMGSNDYINNYLVSGSPTHNQYSPEQYQNLLLSTYSSQLRELYALGARKVAVSSVGPLGCTPAQLAQSSTDGSCVIGVNNLVINFNTGLQQLLTSLNAQIPDAKFFYADIYNPVFGFVSNPTAYGFSTGNMGCCGAGKFNGQLPCLPMPLSSLCSDRNAFVFFDPYHPTEASNIILGRQLYSQVKAALLS